MTTATPEQVSNDGLTAGERAYMESGGDTAGLVKEGLQIEQPAASPPPAPAAAPAPSVSPPAAQEPPASPDDDDDEPQLDEKTGKPRTRGRWVSKKALDEARAELKELRANHSATNEKWARLEERVKTFQEAVSAEEPQAEPEAPMPDPEQDIFGAHRWQSNKIAKLEQNIAQLTGNLTQMHQMSQAEREQMQMVHDYRSDAARFIQAQPDFLNAYQWLLSNRHAELEAAGYGNVAQRNQLIAADEAALARKAFGEQTSPAERIYALAKARGYRLAAAQAAAAAPAAQSNGAAQPAPVANGNGQATPTQSSAADEIARIQAGQNAAMSLSNAGGGSPRSLSIDDLLAMPMDEFKKFAAKNPALLDQMAGK